MNYPLLLQEYWRGGGEARIGPGWYKISGNADRILNSFGVDNRVTQLATGIATTTLVAEGTIAVDDTLTGSIFFISDTGAVTVLAHFADNNFSLVYINVAAGVTAATLQLGGVTIGAAFGGLTAVVAGAIIPLALVTFQLTDRGVSFPYAEFPLRSLETVRERVSALPQAGEVLRTEQREFGWWYEISSPTLSITRQPSGGVYPNGYTGPTRVSGFGPPYSIRQVRSFPVRWIYTGQHSVV